MTTATLFITCTGLLAMSASLGLAWWLWSYDPVWPWTTAAPKPGPSGPQVPPNPPVSAHANQVAALEPAYQPVPLPVPVDESGELATTAFFVKGKTPEKTQVLPDPHDLLAQQRDEDAPAPYEDQLQTTPNRRARLPLPGSSQKLPRY